MIIKAIAYPLDLIEILSLASRRGGFKEIFRGDTDWLVKPAPTPITYYPFRNPVSASIYPCQTHDFSAHLCFFAAWI